MALSTLLNSHVCFIMILQDLVKEQALKAYSCTYLHTPKLVTKTACEETAILWLK